MNINEIVDLKDRHIPGFCDALMNAEIFMQEIESGVIDRKTFCEYLDIRESTLTGWIKDDRIPLMAKEAYILKRMVNVLTKEVKKMTDNLQIVKSGQHYQICKFEEDEDGVLMGHVLIDGIESKKRARFFGSSFSTLQLLHELKGVISEEIAVRDGFASTGYLENLLDRITNVTLYSTKYDDWKSLYGKGRLDNALDLDLSEFEESSSEPVKELTIKCHSQGRHWIRIKDIKDNIMNQYGHNSEAATIVDLIKKLDAVDSSALKKISKLITKGKAKIIAKEDDPALNPRSNNPIRPLHVKDDWYISGCISNTQAVDRVKSICETLDLSYGEDILVSFDYSQNPLDSLKL